MFFIEHSSISSSCKNISFIILYSIYYSISRKNPNISFIISIRYSTITSFCIIIRIYKYRRFTINSIKHIFRNVHLFPSFTIPILCSTISSIIPNITFVRSFICPISTRVICLIPSFSLAIKLSFNTLKFFINSLTIIS